KTETQGMVVAEAMAAGTPVIALDATGVREVVEDGVNGRLLAGDSPQNEFADAIESFFKDRERAESWHKAALQTALEFDRLVCAQRLVELYSSVYNISPFKKQASMDDIFGNWEEVLKSLRIEWEMLSRKINAVAKTLQSSK
ncbi:MAG: glycosyltransferase, partial [Desulfobacterales bacterium]|nr:glycosyltransferase [Desulfobacterales bacterium]